jgi:hypothetical protein
VVLILAVVIGVVIGVVTGGSLAHISSVRIRYLLLLIAALLWQIAIFSPLLGTQEFVHRVGPYIYIGTLVATLFVMLANLHIPGMKLIALGAALNALVITANGGFMPAPESALRASGQLEHVLQDERERADGSYVLTNSKIADDDTNLRFLGDVIAIPHQVPLANVISIGDIVIALGAIIAIVRVMHRRPDDVPKPEPAAGAIVTSDEG